MARANPFGAVAGSSTLAKSNLAKYYIGGSIYVGLRLIFQDGDQIYNFQMIITLLSYVLETYKWLR